jgi:hypothetical protein
LLARKDPPENIEISDRLITVEEGASSGKVLCTAEAYPEANYQWQFANEVVATDNVLFFDLGISRHQSGDYTCVAQNRHGSTKISTKIDVLCKWILRASFRCRIPLCRRSQCRKLSDHVDLHQGTMLRFFKYFRRKIRQKNWRF